MATKPVVAVDIDDTLVAESEFIVAYSNKHWGHAFTLEDYQENWQAMWNVGLAEVERRANELHAPGLATQYALIAGAKEGLLQLQKDYELVILTSRRQMVKDETLAWINDVFADVFREVHFTGFWDEITPGSHLRTKGTLAKGIGAEYLIDDQPKHCIAAATVGVEAVLFGDYATSRNLKLPPNVTRCGDWQAVVEFFDAQRR